MWDAALAAVRAQHPPFFTALIADAKLTARMRNERHVYRGRVDALIQALRLMWVTDAFLGLALYRAKARMQALGIPVLPTIAHRLAIATAQICIGDIVLVRPGVFFGHGFVVMDGVIEVRSGASIHPGVTIGLRGKGRGPTIGKDVVIGTGAKVLGPITVGRGARIGANAVVINDVPAGATVVGAPARIVKRSAPARPAPAPERVINLPRDDERAFFFVHMMRTGGTTFRHHLRQNFPVEQVYPDHDLDFPDGVVGQHLRIGYLAGLSPERRARIRAYTGHLPYVTIELLEIDPITFTLLRDPVERTISLLRVTQKRRLTDLTLEAIYDDPDHFARMIHNHQTKMFSMTPADQPESFRDIIAIDDTRLALAKKNLEQVDIVGLSERYDDFLAEAERRFGWRFEREIRANKAGNDGAVDAAFRRRIAADNAYDVDFYEFARDLVERRKRVRRVTT